MRPANRLTSRLSAEEQALLNSLDSPARIQAFLDETVYPGESFNRAAPRVLRERRAHCLDGGLFAAMALRRLGYPAQIVDLLPEPGRDDDHVLAIYTLDGCLGALAKSNFTGLRSRQPVYRGLRELVMSYFEAFYNSAGERTLRGYTRPLRLAAFDRLHWETEDAGVDAIEAHLKTLAVIPVLSPAQAGRLPPVDPLTFRAGMLAVNPEGLYKPES
jgi:hypothetical protein